MKFDGTNWVNVGSPGFTLSAAYGKGCKALTIDGIGTPYIIYTDNGSAGYATVMKFDGSNWGIIGSPGGASLTPGGAPSIAIDPSGTPYAAYIADTSFDGTSTFGPAAVTKFNGSTWETAGNIDFFGPSGYAGGLYIGFASFISLTTDASGAIYIGYAETREVPDTLNHQGTVMKLGGNTATKNIDNNKTSTLQCFPTPITEHLPSTCHHAIRKMYISL